MVLVRLTDADTDRPVELFEGDTVELCLPETPAGDYRWRWCLPEGLRLITDAHETGQRRLAIDVYARGRHVLRAELARPWESEPRKALTFTVHAK